MFLSIDSYRPMAQWENVYQHALVFLITAGIIILLPGPTYYVGFLLLFILISFFRYRDLSIGLFQTYLLVVVFDAPVLQLKEILLQDYVYSKAPLFLSFPVEIPVRFIIFCAFVLSLLSPKYIRKGRIYTFNYDFITPLVISCLTLLLIVFNQIVSSYRIKFSWPFFHFLQVWFVFPSILLFFIQRIQSKVVLSIARNIFLGFVLYALLLEGIIATGQFIARSSLGTRIERVFEKKNVQSVESGLFRSPGTFEHPNYLGANVSILLPVGIFYIVSIISQRFSGWKRVVSPAAACVFMGFVALLLSVSRWAWISFATGSIMGLFYLKRWVVTTVSTIHITWKHISIFVAAGITIFLIVFNQFRTLRTVQGRSEILQVYVQQISMHPIFGVGQGLSTINLFPYRRDFSVYMNSLKGVHNTLAFVAADNGLPVLFLFIAFLLSNLVYIIREKKIIQKDYFIASLFIGYVIFLMNSVAYPLYLFDPSLEIMFLIVACLTFFSTVGISSKS